MSQTQYSDQGSALRLKPPFEAAQMRYRGVLRDISDRIVKLAPHLVWEVREDGWRRCGAAEDNPRALRFYTYGLFNGPIPDDTWLRALEVVSVGAATLEATHMTGVVNKPGDRDVIFTGPDGVEIEFGTKAATILSIRSDCRLRRVDWVAP